MNWHFPMKHHYTRDEQSKMFHEILHMVCWQTPSPVICVILLSWYVFNVWLFCCMEISEACTNLTYLFTLFRICFLVLVPRVRTYDLVLSAKRAWNFWIWSLCSIMVHSHHSWYTWNAVLGAEQVDSGITETGHGGITRLISSWHYS